MKIKQFLIKVFFLLVTTGKMINVLLGILEQKKCRTIVKKKQFIMKMLYLKFMIFQYFFPKLSHPDPTVDRRSGFLIPYLTNSKNLGSGVSIPYF